MTDPLDILHSPTPEEGDENVRYIIVDPGALSDESQSSKKRPCWEFWETKTLLGIVKELSDASPGGKAQLDENFFLVEQEMRKRGVERWDGGQIQQKWRSLRKDWLSARRGSYRNGTAKTVSEFQDELDELLGTPESHCSLSGADTSGDEITGYDMESLEPRDHVAVVLDNEDKRSRMVTRRSSGSYPGQKDAQGSPPGTKPSTSSDDGRDADFTPGPVKAKKLKMRARQEGPVHLAARRCAPALEGVQEGGARVCTGQAPQQDLGRHCQGHLLGQQGPEGDRLPVPAEDKRPEAYLLQPQGAAVLRQRQDIVALLQCVCARTVTGRRMGRHCLCLCEFPATGETEFITAQSVAGRQRYGTAAYAGRLWTRYLATKALPRAAAECPGRVTLHSSRNIPLRLLPVTREMILERRRRRLA
ncbi:uncharacterized protein LOC134538682 isoform X3 [Bacillus rossius redtenbacheri]|uniref:uncharacterized protein LOC134538682 isoform X3 n=1 Tax=Bacillus rossius redtenbacheri TaxID=93214 RepID=UPI002FDEDA9A